MIRALAPLPLLLLLAHPASAAERTSTLSWVRMEGAEACITAPALAAAVEAQVGRPVFSSPATAALSVEGRAEHLGDRSWRAVLRLTEADGTVLGDRTVESKAESCEELGRAVTVTLALMLDPVTAPAAPAPVAPEPAPPPPKPAAPRWRFDAHTALTGGAGLVPGVALGGRASVGVTPPKFIPVLAEGELIPFAQSTDGTDFSRVVGGLQLCPLNLDSTPFILRGCIGVDAGAIFVLRTDTTLNATEWVLVQGHAALRPSWRIVGPLTLDAALHVFVPFRSVSFTTTRGAEVFTPRPVAGLVDLGVGASF